MPIEKEFVLTHVYKNVSSMKEAVRHFSPVEEHFGVPWKICAVRKVDHLELYLYCNQKQKEDWSIDTWFEIKLSEVIEETISRTQNSAFFSEFGGWGWDEFISWSDAMKDFVIDDTLRVEIRVKIKKVTGIVLKEKKKNLRNFDESTKQFSDVVLVVENQKFYVLKLYLASQSPYFEAMFLRDFKESTTAEIPLKDVKAADFQNFLELLHGENPIDESTVEGIAHLANFYDAEMASRKCEQFLIENSEKSLKQKLKLAHSYSLENLKDHCLSKITTVSDIRSVVTIDKSEMDPSVVGELLEKSLALHNK